MKQEEDDILIKGIRERLDNYSEEVPDELWGAIERELNSSHASSSFLFRKMAIAAAVLIVVIISVSLWVLDMPVDKYVKEVAAVSVPEDGKQSDIGHKQESVISQSVKTVGKKNLVRVEKKKNEGTGRIETENKTILDEVTADKEDVTDIKCSNQDSEQICNQQNEVAKKKEYFYPSRSKSSYSNITAINKKEYMKWSLSVSYANVPSIRNNAIPGFSTLDRDCNLLQTTGLQANDLELSPDGLKKTRPIRKILLNSVGKDAKTDIEHKMPITAGVSFRYKLSKNFAVETGLTYTMLSSELRSGTANDFYIEEYKLHYLGIPLKGNWMFLNTKYLTLYLSAGGELEKSLAGKYKKTYIASDEPELSWNENVKPVQWSLLGSVGAQFNATEHFGIYVEPGVVHYFDDGSKVQTIRKERPTNFNLQLGLRWTY